MARQGQGAWTWSGYHKIRWSYSPGSIDIFKVIGGGGGGGGGRGMLALLLINVICGGYLY